MPRNHYSCPIVASYAENLKNNVEAVTEGKIHYIRPFVAFTSEKTAADRLVKVCKEEWGDPRCRDPEGCPPGLGGAAENQAGNVWKRAPGC